MNLLFKNPDYFTYLLLLIILVGFYIFRLFKREKNIKKWFKGSSPLRDSISNKKRIFKMALSLMVLVFMILALARLQGPGEIIEAPARGNSLLVMLDISLSMLAEDVKPSRLELIKKELSRLIDLSSGDRVALGFFAKSAFLVNSFTPDLSAVKSFLKDLSPDYLSHQGTDFKKAFQLAREVFEREKDLGVKILILASDGEGHDLETEKEIKSLVEEQGIRIFTLSVGTKQGGVIPIKDYKNQIKEYKKNIQGDLVVSRLNPESLRQFSKWGKGAYYHLDYNNLAIKKLRKDLDVLQKNFYGNYTETIKTEYYQWFLLFGFIVAFMELILSNYKKPKRA